MMMMMPCLMAVPCLQLNVQMGLNVGHWKEVCAKKGLFDTGI